MGRQPAFMDGRKMRRGFYAISRYALLLIATIAVVGCRREVREPPGDDEPVSSGTVENREDSIIFTDTPAAAPLGLVAPTNPADERDTLVVPARRGERCDPNYTPCVPVDSDVDCAGGRGNGPSYVEGPVRVIGTDVYKLDRDGDGIGCDRRRGG